MTDATPESTEERDAPAEKPEEEAVPPFTAVRIDGAAWVMSGT
ncbi:hypothetical protein [Haematospirillum jordaniae]|nr:hypothetical protein [Haematospirillum jordaniae]